jgi:hypothetical protein
MMSSAQKHAEDHLTGMTWSSVSGVQPVAFVGRRDDHPVGIVEMLPDRTFRATTSRGVQLGEFASVEEGQRAVERFVDG